MKYISVWLNYLNGFMVYMVHGIDNNLCRITNGLFDFNYIHNFLFLNIFYLLHTIW